MVFKASDVTITNKSVELRAQKVGNSILPSPLWQIIAPKTRATGLASDMMMLEGNVKYSITCVEQIYTCRHFPSIDNFLQK